LRLRATRIDIEVPMLELINRLDQRSKTDRCMPYDSNTLKIVKRVQEHETKTVPVIAKYNHYEGRVLRGWTAEELKQEKERTGRDLEEFFAGLMAAGASGSLLLP
jgi:hypothetical protein